ncbi:lipocalin family protein [Micromonospora okii]|uniref:lipocalin family protein n=1 Tax=Micromonospora okii TaxID=1182970 RepID=UPI001E5A4875|nr:lipocalin family protein [Micromonospora okii]
MNVPLLTAHLTTTPEGAVPAVDVVADLACKPRYTLNSWFVIGHFEADGHTLDYLVHMMALSIRGVVIGVDAAASVTDETTGWYGVRSNFHPFLRAGVRSDRLLVRTPNCLIAGTFDDLRVRARIKGASIDVALRAVGHPLYNRGTGRFDMLGMDVRQYSIPTMETTGRLVVDGREFTASGVSWFDRQWQKQPLGPPSGRWTWMDLNLSNGWRVSLWDAVGADGRTDAWVTVVDETGAHTVADLVPLAHGARDYWLSPHGGSRFPTRWLVGVPDLDMELTVESRPRGQTIQGLSERYEGASTVRGVVRGERVDGYCYVEMVGDWKA